MSFSISVSLPHDKIPMPNDLLQLDAWLDECNKFVLYQQPLGSGHAIFNFWSLIARELQLPLISSIYDNGLSLASPDELNQLTNELNQLENYWNSHKLEETEEKSASCDNLKEDLAERMQYLRTAIVVARENKAVLTIS